MYVTEDCKFFTAVYQYYVKTVINIYLEHDQNEIPGATAHVKQEYYACTRTNVNDIVSNIHRLLAAHCNVAHHKTVVNVLSLLVLKTEGFFSDGNSNRHKRLIMVFGIAQCSPSNFNYLLFNNIDFSNMATLSKVRKRMDVVSDSMTITTGVETVRED